jgi:hypothetical protein
MINRVLLVGRVAETGVILTPSADESPECRLTVLVDTLAVPVVVSSAHALWLTETTSAGVLVLVDGHLRDEGQGLVVQAWQVTPVNQG